jgi:hypothetical protein
MKLDLVEIGWGITPEIVAKVRAVILQDHTLAIQDLCNTLGLSYWCMSTNFVGGTEHEDCGEVGATTAAK